LNEEESEEIIQNVGGFGNDGFDFDRFDRFIARKIERRKEKLLWLYNIIFIFRKLILFTLFQNYKDYIF